MAKGLRLKLVGKERLEMSLGKVREKMREEAAKAVQGAALRTVAKAKMRLQPHPEDDKETVQNIVDVRQSINFSFNKDAISATMHAGNVSGDDIAAYLEFGTGRFAKAYLAGHSSAVQKFAYTFYVNGKGRLPAHPYLLPSFFEEGERLREKLKGLKPRWQ